MPQRKPRPDEFTMVQTIIAFFLVLEIMATIITHSNTHATYSFILGIILAITIYRRMV